MTKTEFYKCNIRRGDWLCIKESDRLYNIAIFDYYEDGIIHLDDELNEAYDLPFEVDVDEIDSILKINKFKWQNLYTLSQKSYSDNGSELPDGFNASYLEFINKDNDAPYPIDYYNMTDDEWIRYKFEIDSTECHEDCLSCGSDIEYNPYYVGDEIKCPKCKYKQTLW